MICCRENLLLHGGGRMSDVERVLAIQIYDRVQTGDALLVCAYNSDDKFASFHLEGAVSFSEFQLMVPTLVKHKELVFYCA